MTSSRQNSWSFCFFTIMTAHYVSVSNKDKLRHFFHSFLKSHNIFNAILLLPVTTVTRKYFCRKVLFALVVPLLLWVAMRERERARPCYMCWDLCCWMCRNESFSLNVNGTIFVDKIPHPFFLISRGNSPTIFCILFSSLHCSI